MKKAILIFSILLSSVLVWYFYTIDNVKSKAIAHEKIEDYQRALEYYKKHSVLSNNNIDYTKKLYEIANKQLDDNDYYNAEKNFEEYKNINLSGGWIFSSVDTNQVNQHKLSTNRLAEEYIEIYENTGRFDVALDLYISKKDELITNGCLNCYLEDLRIYYNDAFDLSYKLNKLDIAFNLYLEQFYAMVNIDDVYAIENVISYKVSQYNNHQKDSILRAVYDSYRITISNHKDSYSYQTNFEIFGERIPAIKTPRPLNRLDSNISITDTSFMINQDWEKFKRTRLYQLLAEKK
jgi:tetratricopeptide (TPR) repeat protein